VTRARIGLFADKLNRPVPTGVGAYVENLSSALHRLGRHDYVLFSTGRPVPSSNGQNAERPPSLGLRGPRQPVHVAWTVLHRPTIERLAADRFDLVHVLVPSFPVPSRAPQVVTIHDLTPLQFPAFYRRSDRVLFRRAVLRAAQRARRVVTDSERSRRDVIELLGVPGDRVRTVHLAPPHGLDVPPPGQVRATLQRYGLLCVPYALFVGELTLRKNPLALVEAWALLEHETRGHRLVLAGAPGLGHDRLVRRIEELGQARRVQLPGRVSQADLPALMSAAKVFVLPSRYEGFGLPALEAMACGTPVVVSDGGALPEVVGDAGLVVPGGDPAGLVSALREVLLDEALAAGLRERGLERVRMFTWERAAHETVDVYEEALSGG
jgi:glycosyltransferase involved in cell wall biosynthesis